MPISKTVHLMWDSKPEKWPHVVQFCINLWREYNPDYEIHVYGKEEAAAILEVDIDPVIYATIKVQHQADLLRTKLLAEQGGIWIDATSMPHKPIHLWIDDFADCDFAGVKTFQMGHKIDNWFIISKERGLLMTKMYNRLKNYWKTPKINLPQDERSIRLIAEKWRFFVSEHAAHDLRVVPYFCWHYLFSELIENDRDLALVFDKQPFSDNNGGCSHLAWNLRDKMSDTDPLTKALKDHIVYSHAPLSKLNRHNPLTTKLIPEFKLCLDERRRIEGF